MNRQVSAPQQEALWWIQQRSPRKDLYNLTWRMSVGELDAKALGRSWQALTDRYEALRTALVQEDGAVWQRIHPQIDATLNELRWPASAQDALLWRAGVLEVGAKTDRAPRRAPENSDLTIESDSLGTGSAPPALRSRPRRQSGPVPTRPGGAPHTRATG